MAKPHASGPLLVILLGPPGSGKGTQAKLLTTQNSDWRHVSTGDLFRKEIASSSPLGLKVKEIIAKGALVSDDLTNQIFESQVTKIISEYSPSALPPTPSAILLDGYPRNRSQAEALLKFCELKNLRTPKTLELLVSQDEVLKRLGGRLVNPRTGVVYHKVYNPPKKPAICDVDVGPLITRPDDQPDTIKSRYALYMNERDGIVQVLKKADSEAAQVPGDQEPEKVEKALESKIKSWL